MLTETAGERFGELSDLRSESPFREISQFARVALTGDERVEHEPARHPLMSLATDDSLMHDSDRRRYALTVLRGWRRRAMAWPAFGDRCLATVIALISHGHR